MFWTSVNDDGYSGYDKSLEEAEWVRKAFEVASSLTFVSEKREAGFSHHGLGKFRLPLT